MVNLSACAPQFSDGQKRADIYSAEISVYYREYCFYHGDSSKCHGDWLSISVEASPFDLVLYTCQQVEAELDKIKNHPDYTKVMSVDVSECEPSVELQSSSAARVFEEARSLGAKVPGKSHISILNETSLETGPMSVMA